MAPASSALHRIMPPLGPRSSLWVVLVTTSAWGSGLMWQPVAQRPEMWLMSATSFAPHFLCDFGKRREIDLPGIGGGAREK